MQWFALCVKASEPPVANKVPEREVKMRRTVTE